MLGGRDPPINSGPLIYDLTSFSTLQRTVAWGDRAESSVGISRRYRSGKKLSHGAGRWERSVSCVKLLEVDQL